MWSFLLWSIISTLFDSLFDSFLLKQTIRRPFAAYLLIVRQIPLCSDLLAWWLPVIDLSSPLCRAQLQIADWCGRQMWNTYIFENDVEYILFYNYDTNAKEVE